MPADQVPGEAGGLFLQGRLVEAVLQRTLGIVVGHVGLVERLQRQDAGLPPSLHGRAPDRCR